MPIREDERYQNQFSELRWCGTCSKWFHTDNWNGGHPLHGPEWRQDDNTTHGRIIHDRTVTITSPSETKTRYIPYDTAYESPPKNPFPTDYTKRYNNNRAKKSIWNWVETNWWWATVLFVLVVLAGYAITHRGG